MCDVQSLPLLSMIMKFIGFQALEEDKFDVSSFIPLFFCFFFTFYSYAHTNATIVLNTCILI